jgi:hypothetical protein
LCKRARCPNIPWFIRLVKGGDMPKSAIEDHRALGSAVLARFEEAGVPKALAPHATAFKKAHQAFEKAADVVDGAKKKRDAALGLVGDADTALDGTVDPLADKMIGAGLGTRRNAFGEASKHSPSALKALPYKTEIQAVRDLVDAVAAKGPPPDVKKCLEASSKAAAACEAALSKLTAPQAAYSRALGARDALLVPWTTTFSKLRANAKAVWHDEPATFDAMFAPPDKVQRPVKKRKKAKPKPAPNK